MVARAEGIIPMQGSSTQGNTLRSVKHAMGPSFGSLCFGSAILTLVQLIRNAMESCAPAPTCHWPQPGHPPGISVFGLYM